MLTNNVRRIRISSDLTQEELAERVSCTRQTINSIEKDRYNPSLELALKIADVLQTDINNLFQLKKE